jgi:hypothetical protein
MYRAASRRTASAGILRTWRVVFVASVLASGSAFFGTTPSRADDNTTLPPVPAVFSFRGGSGDFDGTYWDGGPEGYDALCEGLIRQQLGLLDLGRPIPIPESRLIRFRGKVIGFTGGRAGRYRAINIDAAPQGFASAWSRLGLNGDSLYSCGHGLHDGPTKKGGMIELEGGADFDGFRSPPFPMGTEASDLPAYPPPPRLQLFPPGVPGPVPINVYLHHCWSGLDPDGAGPKHSVSETLGGVGNTIRIVHDHQRTATIAAGLGLAPGGSPYARQQATLALAGRPTQDEYKTLTFGGFLAHFQTIADAAAGPGRVSVTIAYADTGEGADPPGLYNANECAIDETPPLCAITSVTPTELVVTVQDDISGLQTLTTTSSNVRDIKVTTVGGAEGQGFPPTTNWPVTVTATKDDESKSASLTLTLVDAAGNIETCDPVHVDLVRGDRPIIERLSGLPREEHLITLVNGDPGLSALVVRVNGVRFPLANLVAGERRQLDVGTAMVPGNDNEIVFIGEGPRGSSASVLVHD